MEKKEEKSQEFKFLIKKNKNLIEKLRSLDLDFNDLFILECFKYPEERDYLNLFTIPSIKDFQLSARYQFLKKEEFLVEDPYNTSQIILSIKGKNLMDELSCLEDNKTTTKVVINKKSSDDYFEEWWKTYPTSPAWESDDKQLKFAGSRTLKNMTKANAKKKYLKLLNQGLTHDELLGSLLYEIKLKKVDSIKKNINQMDFFKGMEAYFNSERYLMYLDNYRDNPGFVKTDEKIKSRKSNVTDI